AGGGQGAGLPPEHRRPRAAGEEDVFARPAVQRGELPAHRRVHQGVPADLHGPELRPHLPDPRHDRGRGVQRPHAARPAGGRADRQLRRRPRRGDERPEVCRDAAGGPAARRGVRPVRRGRAAGHGRLPGRGGRGRPAVGGQGAQADRAVHARRLPPGRAGARAVLDGLRPLARVRQGDRRGGAGGDPRPVPAAEGPPEGGRDLLHRVRARAGPVRARGQTDGRRLLPRVGGRGAAAVREHPRPGGPDRVRAGRVRPRPPGRQRGRRPERAAAPDRAGRRGRRPDPDGPDRRQRGRERGDGPASGERGTGGGGNDDGPGRGSSRGRGGCRL
ncbi:MAG: hypothetical protein AVDCRST_MAG64-1826, partial [uncultured Phycisphaerae bacterium]